MGEDEWTQGRADTWKAGIGLHNDRRRPPEGRMCRDFWSFALDRRGDRLHGQDYRVNRRIHHQSNQKRGTVLSLSTQTLQK